MQHIGMVQECERSLDTVAPQKMELESSPMINALLKRFARLLGACAYDVIHCWQTANGPELFRFVHQRGVYHGSIK